MTWKYFVDLDSLVISSCVVNGDLDGKGSGVGGNSNLSGMYSIAFGVTGGNSLIVKVK